MLMSENFRGSGIVLDWHEGPCPGTLVQEKKVWAVLFWAMYQPARESCGLVRGATTTVTQEVGLAACKGHDTAV